MKKIILLFIILLTCGCYDYVELNNLSIISSIAIDYETETNKYILTLEVLNDTNTDENGKITAYDVSSEGINIQEAFNNVAIALNKIPYYYHLKVLIISEEIAKNHLEEITDYFFRNPKIIRSFYLVMSQNVKAKDILSIKNENHLVIGNEIVSKIENSSNEYNISYNEYYEDFLESLINKRKDAILTTLTLKDNNIETIGIALFKDNNLIKVLDKESSALLNILRNETSNLILDNDLISIKIYENKTNINFNKDILININAEAQIINNKKNNDLKQDDTYLKFNEDFSNILALKIETLISDLNQLKIDPIGIKWLAYQKHRKDIDLNNININVDLKVNKKGLIFGVNYDK